MAQEFANLIHHNYPGQDYDDLMSAVDAAIAQGYVDADNLFVTGGSGGGVLTAWIVGKTTRFRAAVTQKPVINWTSTVLTTDIAPFMPKYWFGKLPWEDPDAYWKRSPLSLVGAVKTPTLVLVGDQDFRTPLSDSEQYYQALQLAGVPTGLVKVPGASHGGLTARPSQSAAKASAILAWFERYRGKERGEGNSDAVGTVPGEEFGGNSALQQSNDAALLSFPCFSLPAPSSAFDQAVVLRRVGERRAERRFLRERQPRCRRPPVRAGSRSPRAALRSPSRRWESP